MLERLISAEEIGKSPWKIVLLGILYASFSIIIAYLIFPSEADISMIFLATILCMPLLHRFITLEQNTCLVKPKRKLNFCRTITESLHPKLITLFSILFIVFIVTFTAWYVLLPQDLANSIFGLQKQTITSINQDVGRQIATEITGNAISDDIFSIIVLNNVKVLLFSFILSFLFGAGAIFVLTWNTSVISVAIGELFIKNIYVYGSGIGSATKAFSRYMIHGVPELVAYLVAIFSGVFVSIGVIRFSVKSKEFVKLLITSLNLIIFSLIILIFSAILEVYISPFIV